jgi:glycosyltransferase involved in cell wall biosynthesis
MRRMPSVSIITPLYNKASYVAETIDSMLAQTMTNWEMIVVENGSTDQGPEVVLQFKDSRIRLIESSKRGPGAARNVGIGEASGEWLLFLDADDLLQPNQLQSLLDCIPGDEPVDLVAGGWRKFSDNSRELQEEERPACEGKTLADLLDSAIAFAPWAVHAVIVRRSILTQQLFWPEHLDRFLGEDIAFWFKLLNSASRWISSPAAGALYRWKTVDCRTRNEDSAKWFEGCHHAVDANLAFLKEINRQPTARQSENLMRLYEGLLLLALRDNNKAIAKESLELARSWLLAALRLAPTRPTLWARQILGLNLFNQVKSRMG